MANHLKNHAMTRKTLIRGLLAAVGMFGFGFAMVPLYDVFCQVTGLNGKTSNTPYAYKNSSASVDKSRQVTVQFVATHNKEMPWLFTSDITEITLHPGEVGKLSFTAVNPTDRQIIGQAIPSVSPFQATNYLHKVECFCFTTQTLKPGEKKVMPLHIIVDQEIPKHITKLTLSYTLFDVTELGETPSPSTP
ncbi:Cytochrome c oxidase assembly protein CtaG [invertebrate metagenome]|uniref:Cytochrome c oxidase assembly protein CtaG n=1 Tax=invertebrate metagenome TaxID=1711999 RepID=A0A2H9T8R3_9ZZZZ